MVQISSKKCLLSIALIRADASKQVGMGHLARACLIADMLKKRFKISAKLIIKKDHSAESFIRKYKIERIYLPNSLTKRKEIELLRKIIKKEKPKIFFIDLLDYDSDFLYTSSIRDLGCLLVVITDNSDKRLINADLIINGNPCQLEKYYFRVTGKYLLGPKYFIMDTLYEKIKPKNRSGCVRKILLNFGGSDQNNLMFRVLDVFKDSALNLSFLIVISEASGYETMLMKYLKNFSFKHSLLVDTKSLAPLWKKCDLALTAGGNTLFERIASGIPGATLCQLKRQMEIADCFEILGVNFNLGFGPNITDELLSRRIINFINNRKEHQLQRQRCRKILDGKGLRRFTDEIHKLMGLTFNEL